jgi:hypothetical protein
MMRLLHCFDAIASAAQGRIGEFPPQGLANTAWSFATLRRNAPLLFDAIASAAQARIFRFRLTKISPIRRGHLPH